MSNISMRGQEKCRYFLNVCCNGKGCPLFISL
ncbi:hypothetical protein Golax_021710 [Gossypium laxum]|uniref:Uncharacterized protein n=1 Tax=Gossypium laxum TaxID=34288 RepID=A0A7J9ALY0_9ROSI|nr:hypothetical protein [Gossypium laxum]